MAAGISPIDFSHKLVGLWGGRLIFAPKTEIDAVQIDRPSNNEATEANDEDKATTTLNEPTTVQTAAVVVVSEAAASVASSATDEDQEHPQSNQEAHAPVPTNAKSPVNDTATVQPAAAVVVSEAALSVTSCTADEDQEQPQSNQEGLAPTPTYGQSQPDVLGSTVLVTQASEAHYQPPSMVTSESSSPEFSSPMDLESFPQTSGP
jgi:hypothetical protein